MPKISLRAFRPKKQDSHQKLLTAAIDLFWLDGFSSISVDDICRNAKVHKGSFYHYFSSKTELAVAAIEKLWMDHRPLLDQAFSPVLLPQDRIAAYARLVYQKQFEKQQKYGRVIGCPFSNCGGEICANNDAAREKMGEMMDFCTRYFESLIRDYAAHKNLGTVDAKPIAQEMQSYVMGVLTSARIRNDIDIIRRDLEAGLKRYLPTSSISANSANDDATKNFINRGITHV